MGSKNGEGLGESYEGTFEVDYELSMGALPSPTTRKAARGLCLKGLNGPYLGRRFAAN